MQSHGPRLLAAHSAAQERIYHFADLFAIHMFISSGSKGFSLSARVSFALWISDLTAFSLIFIISATSPYDNSWYLFKMKATRCFSGNCPSARLKQAKLPLVPATDPEEREHCRRSI